MSLSRGEPFSLDAGIQPRFAFSALRAGAAALAAGPDVYVIDRFGLADPVASHFKVVVLSKPGHDKFMNSQWVEGRFASASDVRRLTGLPGYGAQLVYNAVRCTKIAHLIHDVSDPLTFTRFFDNFADAAGNTALEIPTDAQEAAAKFCPRRRPK